MINYRAIQKLLIDGYYINLTRRCEDDLRFSSCGFENTIYLFIYLFSRSRFVRSKDREMNSINYPALCYPEVYLLHNGYKNFYEHEKVNYILIFFTSGKKHRINHKICFCSFLHINFSIFYLYTVFVNLQSGTRLKFFRDVRITSLLPLEYIDTFLSISAREFFEGFFL